MAKAGAYQLNTRKFFKIWFSTNPHSFMGLFNQKRLINMKATNKDAAMTLIYYKNLLEPKEVKKLEEFAKNNNISLLELNDIRPMLVDEHDINMFNRCVTELNHLGKGGNPAAASDCLRTLVPLLEKYGIYSDCDVDIDFSSL